MPFRRQGAFGLHGQTSVSLKLNTNTPTCTQNTCKGDLQQHLLLQSDNQTSMGQTSSPQHPLSHSTQPQCCLHRRPAKMPHTCSQPLLLLGCLGSGNPKQTVFSLPHTKFPDRLKHCTFLPSSFITVACIFYIVVRARNYFILDPNTPILLSSRGYQMKVQGLSFAVHPYSRCSVNLLAYYSASVLDRISWKH